MATLEQVEQAYVEAKRRYQEAVNGGRRSVFGGIDKDKRAYNKAKEALVKARNEVRSKLPAGEASANDRQRAEVRP